MRHYLDSIVNFLLGRSAEELIVGVFLALTLAIATASLHNLIRGRVKDNVMILTVVGLVANILVMILTAGYIEMGSDNGQSVPNSDGFDSWRRPNSRQDPQVPLNDMVLKIFDNADTDRDGLLSADEAASCASDFIKEAERRGGRKIDRADLSFLILSQMNRFDGRRRGPQPNLPPVHTGDFRGHDPEWAGQRPR
ncbi:hypothetical protein P12x_000872 [Tundrisphaera lichenicola]|uniref:hypothetical protein n=1 Tax=Tundrisphaera lichenicola TaxID=2029860 RepID=UPI003EB74A7B